MHLIIRLLLELLLFSLLNIKIINCTQNDEHRALIIIDVQNCFTEGGTMEVENGNEIIPLINNIRSDYDTEFDLVALSQDWHCVDHVSFYTEFPGYDPYDIVPLYYSAEEDLCTTEIVTSPHAVNCTGNSTKLDQTLWPPHCVINTTDANLHPELTYKSTDVTVRKGYHCQLDSYSVFYDNGQFGETEMNDVLQAAGIDTVFITGLATDYCVYWTAKDAFLLGYKTYVIEDATRPVSNATGDAAIDDMKQIGIHVIKSFDLETILPGSGGLTVSAHISYLIFSFIALNVCQFLVM